MIIDFEAIKAAAEVQVAEHKKMHEKILEAPQPPGVVPLITASEAPTPRAPVPRALTKPFVIVFPPKPEV